MIPWLKTNDPNYVKVKEDVDWAGLKKKLIYVDGHMATEDGEIVPGITAVKRPDKFAVEVK